METDLPLEEETNYYSWEHPRHTDVRDPDVLMRNYDHIKSTLMCIAIGCYVNIGLTMCLFL